jgi:predicted secreted protein
MSNPVLRVAAVLALAAVPWGAGAQVLPPPANVVSVSATATTQVAQD